MILRVQYLFTHKETGEQYISRGFYETGSEAFMQEDEGFKSGDWIIREATSEEVKNASFKDN